MEQRARMLLGLALLLATPVVAQNRQKDEGQACSMPGGAPGVCRKLNDCPSVLKNVKEKIFNHTRCSFIRFEEVVCCSPVVRMEARIGARSEEKCNEFREELNNFIVPYIIRGEEVTQGEFPHMAAVGFKPRNNSNVSWACGGSLVSERYVLTAAHCIETKSMGKPKVVRLGHIDIVNNLEDLGADYEVEDTVVHPNYSSNANYYDIGLLRLAQPVRLSAYQFPACLYTNQEDPSTDLVVTGWGDINGDGVSSSPLLLKASLQKVPLDSCQTTYGKLQRLQQGVVEGMLCADNPVNRSDTCKGDSGGPLQVENDRIFSIVGVTSFGPIQCGGTFPGVYTRVVSYLSWMESIIWA